MVGNRFLLVIISNKNMISITNIVINNGSNKILYSIDSFIFKFVSELNDLVIPQRGHGIWNIFLKGQVIFFDNSCITFKNITCPIKYVILDILIL